MIWTVIVSLAAFTAAMIYVIFEMASHGTKS